MFTATPDQVQIVFSILDKTGETILPDVAPESDISMVRDASIRLSAELRTTDPERTPVLLKWALHCK